MKEGKETEKRSVHFGQEDYNQVIKAIKSLGNALRWLRLNRSEGIVSLEVDKGTSLEGFNHIKDGEKTPHDRRLKVRITPLTPADEEVLQLIFMLTIGDFAKEFVRVDFEKEVYLTIVFSNHKAKEKFFETLREMKIPKKHPKDPLEHVIASVTIKA